MYEYLRRSVDALPTHVLDEDCNLPADHPRIMLIAHLRQIMANVRAALQAEAHPPSDALMFMVRTLIQGCELLAGNQSVLRMQ